jgi:hypothetical protein
MVVIFIVVFTALECKYIFRAHPNGLVHRQNPDIYSVTDGATDSIGAFIFACVFWTVGCLKISIVTLAC